MKTLVILLMAVSLFFAVPSITVSSKDQNVINHFANKKISEPERRGCCSWHGGVCGCRGGRVVCCDGTLSPSCT